MSLVTSAEAYLIATCASHILVGFFGLLIILAVSHKTKTDLSFIFFCLGTLLISLTTFRVGGPFFNGSDLFYLLSVLLVLIHVLATEGDLDKLFIKDNPLFIPLMIFLFGAILSMQDSTDPKSGIIVIGKYIFLFGVWLPAGIFIFDSGKKIKWMLISLGVASLFPISIGISDYFLHTRMTAYFDNLLSLNLETTEPVWGRFGTIMAHPNNFAILLAIVFPMALGMVMLAKDIFIRFLGLIYGMAILTSCMITGSRSVLVAIGVESLLLPCLVFGKRKALAIILCLVIFASLLSILNMSTKIFPQGPWARMALMVDTKFGTYIADLERIESMKGAWGYIKDNPIAGAGVENAAAITEKLFVHNTVLRLWASVGILGLIAVIWFYLKPIMTASYLQKSVQDRQIQNLVAVISSSMSGWMLFDMFQPQFHNRMKWIMVVALFAIVNIDRRRSPNTDKAEVFEIK